MKTLLPPETSDLTGKQFVSPRFVNPFVWTVLRYHRCDSWVCEEAQHKTTCEFYTSEITEWMNHEN